MPDLAIITTQASISFCAVSPTFSFEDSIPPNSNREILLVWNFIANFQILFSRFANTVSSIFRLPWKRKQRLDFKQQRYKSNGILWCLRFRSIDYPLEVALKVSWKRDTFKTMWLSWSRCSEIICLSVEEWSFFIGWRSAINERWTQLLEPFCHSYRCYFIIPQSLTKRNYNKQSLHEGLKSESQNCMSSKWYL